MGKKMYIRSAGIRSKYDFLGLDISIDMTVDLLFLVISLIKAIPFETLRGVLNAKIH